MRKALYLGIILAMFVSCQTKEQKDKEYIDNILEQRKNDDKSNIDTSTIDTAINLKKQEEYDKLNKAVKERLSPFFNKKADEFSSSKTIWYTPKDAPRYVNQNGIYCYFQVNKGIASNLRLKIQYAAEDWLFWKTVLFSIDGLAYEYTPLKVETDNDNGIWEWSDEQITAIDHSVLIALTLGKSGKMKLVGNQYHKIKTITPKQFLSIKRTYNLYKAMGGNI